MEIETLIESLFVLVLRPMEIETSLSYQKMRRVVYSVSFSYCHNDNIIVSFVVFV